jgi:hypothetical protein
MVQYQNSGNNLAKNQPVTSVTSAVYAATLSDLFIEVNFAGAVAISLPAPSFAIGKSYILKDVSGSALTNNITITAVSGSIDGAANVKINTNYGFVELFSDGTNYFINSQTAVAAGSFSWSVNSLTAISLSANVGYILTNAAAQTCTLPITVVAGALFEITEASSSTGLFTLAQNAGQVIRFGAQTTTAGATGSIVATQQGNSLRFVCTTANTNFSVVNSVGNFIIN